MAGKSKEEVEKLMIGFFPCLAPEKADETAGPANTPITMIFTRPPSTQGKSSAQGEQVERSSKLPPTLTSPSSPQIVVTLLRSKGPAQPNGASQPRPAELVSSQHDAPKRMRQEAQGSILRMQPKTAGGAGPELERAHPPYEAPNLFDPRGGESYVQASSRSTRNFRRPDVRAAACRWPAADLLQILTPMDEFSDISFLWGEPVSDPKSTGAGAELWKTKALYGPGVQEFQLYAPPRQLEKSRALPLQREHPVMANGENFLPFRDSIVSKVLLLLLPRSFPPPCILHVLRSPAATYFELLILTSSPSSPPSQRLLWIRRQHPLTPGDDDVPLLKNTVFSDPPVKNSIQMPLHLFWFLSSKSHGFPFTSAVSLCSTSLPFSSLSSSLVVPSPPLPSPLVSSHHPLIPSTFGLNHGWGVIRGPLQGGV
eukprot:766233-Hanusia_phi.AAC.5